MRTDPRIVSAMSNLLSRIPDISDDPKTSARKAKHTKPRRAKKNEREQCAVIDSRNSAFNSGSLGTSAIFPTKSCFSAFSVCIFRRSLYRPFCKKWLCFDRLLNERVYLTPALFPNEEAEAENVVICCTTHTQMPYICMVTNCLPNEAVGGRNGQCFGFYTYSDDGHARTENITDWALEEFREHYADRGISKWDIFHYVYAMLHHPLYREHFAQNLRNKIPRVPLVKDFRKCSDIGHRLKDLHLSYETAAPHALEWRESATEPLSYRVTGSMVLNKEQGTIRVNSSLTLAGIPAETFDYVLGTRSALEWVVDQYHCETDPHTGITSDPNDPKTKNLSSI